MLIVVKGFANDVSELRLRLACNACLQILIKSVQEIVDSRCKHKTTDVLGQGWQDEVRAEHRPLDYCNSYNT